MEPIPHKYQDDYLKIIISLKEIEKHYLPKEDFLWKLDIHDIPVVQSVGLN